MENVEWNENLLSEKPVILNHSEALIKLFFLLALLQLSGLSPQNRYPGRVA